MTSLTVTIPLPPRELSPNGRCHWAKKRKAAQQQKHRAWAEAFIRLGGSPSNLEGKPTHWKRARVTTTFYVRDQRGLKRDGDNALASLKAAFDGIAEAGVVVNDRGFVHQPVVFAIDKDIPRVEIHIERIEE